MRATRPIAFILGVTLIAVHVLAGPASANGAPPKELACTFQKGSTIAYANGAYSSTTAKPLAFNISAINLDNQSATLLADSGTGSGSVKLRVVRAVNANHFLEVVTEGFLNMTTIYDQDARSGSFPAVHSRHFGLFGEPIVAQYYGFCKAQR
jgi:hypothetical protein